MIRVRRYHETGEVEEAFDPEAVSECLGQRGTLLWVDVEDPTPDDVAVLAEEFDVHHLAAEDLLEPASRPRFARFPDHFLLVVRDPFVDNDRLTTREIDLVFGDGWIITVRKPGEDGSPPAPLDEFVERFERIRREDGATDEGFVIYVVLDTVVDRCFSTADALEGRLDEVEAKIFAAQPDGTGAPATDSSVTQRLYELRGDFVSFRRVVAPLREALAPLLRGEASFIEPAALVHLRDVYDLTIRVTETIDALRDLLNGALEAHLSIQSNRMNLVMKRATSWGAILVTATLIAGIYGMNFEHMPELDWAIGYPLALGVMLIVTLILYRTFKRRDWL